MHGWELVFGLNPIFQLSGEAKRRKIRKFQSWKKSLITIIWQEWKMCRAHMQSYGNIFTGNQEREKLNSHQHKESFLFELKKICLQGRKHKILRDFSDKRNSSRVCCMKILKLPDFPFSRDEKKKKNTATKKLSISLNFNQRWKS